MREASVAVFAGGGTGGHLYPALALAEELVRQRPDVRPFFLGARRGLETRVLPEKGLEHLLLPVRGIHRRRLLPNLGVPWALARSVTTACRLLRRLKPGLVVVTGGYAGAPAGMAAAMAGIPLVLQEQNAWPGMTTRLLSRWAAQVHLAFPEAAALLPASAREAVRVSGCPIRLLPDHQPVRRDACERLGLDPTLKVLLVVGGSQGSAPLNALVRGALGQVAKRMRSPLVGWQVLWATGTAHYQRIARALSVPKGSDAVRIVPYIEEMPTVLSLTDLAVSRAGAMTTAELLAWGVPAVLVPLPTAAANHQELNARVLEESGAAIHLPQGGLTAGRLWDTVVELARDEERLGRMSRAARMRSRPEATRGIVADMVRLLPGLSGKVAA